MKKALRILLIVLLIAVVAAAALAWHYRDYLRAYHDARKFTTEDLQQQMDDNNAVLDDILSQYLPQQESAEPSDLPTQETPPEPVAPNVPAIEPKTEVPAAPDESKPDPEVVRIVEAFNALRTDYLARLEAMKDRAYREYKEKTFTKKELVDFAAGFVREATVMEVECDNQVFALLGELEKVIEKNGGDKSLPDKILGVYLNEKQLTKAKYISELEKRGLIL